MFLYRIIARLSTLFFSASVREVGTRKVSLALLFILGGLIQILERSQGSIILLLFMSVSGIRDVTARLLRKEDT